MCQHNLPCSIVYAHCLLPGRAFASLYVLLFLEKEAEIGGHEYLNSDFSKYSLWVWEVLNEPVLTRPIVRTFIVRSTSYMGKCTSFWNLPHIYSNKKETSIFHGPYLLIQLRCPNKNKTKMFPKRSTYENWQWFDFIFLSEMIIEHSVKIAFSFINRKTVVKIYNTIYVNW